MQLSIALGRARLLALVVAGIAFGFIAYHVQIDNLFSGTTPERAAAQVLVGWSFVGAGLAAWSLRPSNRIGPLITLIGFAYLARQFRYSHDEEAFTIFFLVGEFAYALFVHAVLAYPSGFVRDRAERIFLKVAYATATLFPLAILLVYDGSQRLRYFDLLPRESFLLVWRNGDLARALQDVYAVTAYGVLASTFIVLIARRLIRATPRARRMLAPLVLAAVVAALRAVFDSIVTFHPPVPDAIYENLLWWQVLGVITLPIVLVVGLLRTHLDYAAVGELARRLEHLPPEEFATALGAALRDPSLEVALWLPDRAEYVDAAGKHVALPPDDRRRAVTVIEDDGGAPIAALVYDPALRDEPDLVESAAASARLALENARLHAELRARLAEVQESRRRIVEAADAARLKIERDLHDGAQQVLLAVQSDLNAALRRHGANLEESLQRALERAVAGLDRARRELRELAQGIHPPVLTEQGLAAALESLGDGMPVRVTLTEAPPDRLPVAVEAAAYFVACEAVTNAATYAHATTVQVSAQRDNGTLRVEVADDGVGGADPAGGGLRGLADRVEALDGRFGVESRSRGGTTVWAEIPCRQ